MGGPVKDRHVTENDDANENANITERPRLVTNRPEIPVPSNVPFTSQFNDPNPFSRPPEAEAEIIGEVPWELTEGQ